MPPLVVVVVVVVVVVGIRVRQLRLPLPRPTQARGQVAAFPFRAAAVHQKKISGGTKCRSRSRPQDHCEHAAEGWWAGSCERPTSRHTQRLCTLGRRRRERMSKESQWRRGGRAAEATQKGRLGRRGREMDRRLKRGDDFVIGWEDLLGAAPLPATPSAIVAHSAPFMPPAGRATFRETAGGTARCKAKASRALQQLVAAF